MPAKHVDLPSVGLVKLYKRRGTKSIRLSISNEGHVRVTLPMWTPYRVGMEFVLAKEDWILAQLPQTNGTLKTGDLIGKASRMVFLPQTQRETVTTRLVGTEVRVIHPAHLDATHPIVQKNAKSAAERALRQQAEQLLPQRIRALAAAHGFSYNSVAIKRLKRRWGSCTSKQDIVLNLYLMQLSWELIDYVIIHELIHTEILHHGPEFWSLFERTLPTAKRYRKNIRAHQPVLQAQQ